MNASDDLLDRFVELLAASDPGDSQPCKPLWALLVAHPWYQKRLTAITRNTLFRAGAPGQWAEDIQQDVIVLLARDLRSSFDHHVDVDRVAVGFCPWLSAIIANHVRQSLRRMSHSDRMTGELLEQAYERTSLTSDTLDCALVAPKAPRAPPCHPGVARFPAYRKTNNLRFRDTSTQRKAY